MLLTFAHRWENSCLLQNKQSEFIHLITSVKLKHRNNQSQQNCDSYITCHNIHTLGFTACHGRPKLIHQASINVYHEGTDLWDPSLFTCARHFQHDFLLPPCGCGLHNDASPCGPRTFHTNDTLEVVFTHSRWVGLTVLTDVWRNSFSWSHILRVSWRSCCSVPGWPTPLPACLVFLAMGVMPGGVTPPPARTKTHARTRVRAHTHKLIHTHTQTYIHTHCIRLCEVSYYECRLSCDACVPLFWEAPYPVQSFCVTPAFPFLCSSTPEDEWANWKLLLQFKYLGLVQRRGSSGVSGV